jgi:MATE family multidrug resistance protein
LSEKTRSSITNPNKKIWAIAGPAIIANSSAPLVGLVDTWVIGHMPGAVHLAAVGVGAAIFSFLFWGFGFLRMSTTGLVAQAHGRKSTQEITQTMARSIILGILIAAIILLLQSTIFWVAEQALAPPDAAKPLVADYFHVRIWAAPATLFIYSLTGYLLGTAQAKAALYLQLLLNISNGILNLVFVIGLDMGVTGIALGSAIAEWLAAAFGLYLLARKFGLAPIITAATNRATYTLEEISKLLSANGYIFLRTLLLMTALAMVTRQAATLGEAALAANQVLITFLLLISLGLDAFAHAAEAYVGSAYGKKDKTEFRFWVMRTNLWAGGIALFYSLGFYLAGDMLIDTLTNIESVRINAKGVLPVMALMPVFAVWCYQFDGIFIGATAGRGMLLTMAAAFIGYAATVSWLTASYGLTGLWMALTLFMTLRGLAQLVYYPRVERKLQDNIS